MVWNSLCRPNRPQTQRSAHRLPSCRIKGILTLTPGQINPSSFGQFSLGVLSQGQKAAINPQPSSFQGSGDAWGQEDRTEGRSLDRTLQVSTYHSCRSRTANPLYLEQWGSVAPGSHLLRLARCISPSPRDLVFSRMRQAS